jgi:hypothetical protein
MSPTSYQTAPPRVKIVTYVYTYEDEMSREAILTRRKLGKDYRFGG